MSDSNRVRVSVIKEVTAGTTPSTPTLLVVPKTSQTLRDSVRYVESAIIRNDANIQGVQKISEGVTGGIASELFYSPTGEAMQLLIAAALRNTETAATTQVTGVTSTSNVLAAAGIDTGIEVGDVVRVRDSGDALVGYAIVSEVDNATPTITVTGLTIPDAGGYKVYRGHRTKNGTTEDHFSVEVERLDASLFQIFRGWTPGRMGIRIADEQISTIQFDGEGMNSARAGTTYGSGHTEATAATSMTATGVPTLLIGGVAYEATDISFDIDNRVRARRKVGTEGPTSLRRGSFAVTGQATVYMDAWTELDKYAAGTASDIVIVQVDAAGNAYSLSIPQMKFTDGVAETRGRDQDDFARLSFQAELDPDEAISLRWQRFVA